MNKYSKISKSIGWDARTVQLPSLEEAQQLYNEVVAGNVFAFERVFIIHRFTPSGITAENFEVSNMLYEAFKKGKEIWENVE